tara:strand:+ start:97 stop:471 length:375 start_codon:yes stop_codon:yes gene_type:complete
MLPNLVDRELTNEEKEVYGAPYQTVESRHVLLRFSQDVPMNGKPEHVHEMIVSYSQWLKETEIPKLCLYITPGVGFQAVDREVEENEFKNTEMINFGEGNHFLQEDYPHTIGELIAAWIAKNNL